MTLWRFEVRKLLRRNRGLLIAALFLLAEAAVLLLGDRPVNGDAARSRGEYLPWLERVEGPWTPEKAAYLEDLARESGTRWDAGFDVLYKQYLYVSEGKENRYFLDANGWAGLLSDRGPDIPLTAAVIALCVPVYCGEAEKLALTSREGRRLFLRYKILLALAVTLALTSAAEVLRLGFFTVKYGLPHGGYPVQSLELYGSAEKELSLWGAEALTAGLRLLGAAELCLLTLCVSALSGQFALASFLAAAAAVLPWMGLGRQVQYGLPLPSSLMTAAGFLRGSEFEADAVTGESVAVFREVSWGGLWLACAGAALVCAVCCLLIWRRYKTALSGGRGRRLAVFTAALCLLLTGCGRAPELPEAARIYAYNGLTVSAREGEIAVTDGEGNRWPLIRDPLTPVTGAVYGSEFYAQGRYVYLWREETEGYGEKPGVRTGKVDVRTLVRVDLETFTAETVWEEARVETVLGIDAG